MKVSKMRTKTTVFQKLAWVIQLGGKSKGVRGRGLIALWKNTPQKRFFLFFWHLLRHLKNCNICHVLHWYPSLVKILLKFELIKAHLSSFRFFSAHSGLLIWAHLGPFWARIGLFWIYLGSWACLGSFRTISAYLGSSSLGLFRLIRAHLVSFKLI